MVDATLKLPERDFAGSAYVPVYVMLPVSVLYFLLIKLDLVNLF